MEGRATRRGGQPSRPGSCEPLRGATTDQTGAAAGRTRVQDAVDLRVSGELERGPTDGGSESSKASSLGRCEHVVVEK